MATNALDRPRGPELRIREIHDRMGDRMDRWILKVNFNIPQIHRKSQTARKDERYSHLSVQFGLWTVERA